MASCSYIMRNKQGDELLGFREYRKNLGYVSAVEVFVRALSPDFQNDFKKYLKYDEQHVPTYESVMTVPYIKNLLGTQKLANAAQKNYTWVTNTRNDYERLVSEAYIFNTSNPDNKSLTAIVEQSEDNKNIRVSIVEKNPESDKKATDQYGVLSLNRKLSEIFANIGVTVGNLEQYEAEKTNGMVDFSKANSMADGFEKLIRIANNAEGVNALPEEFSHLIIGIFREEPLVQRSLIMLSENNTLSQEILGDDYQMVVDSYEGNDNIRELVAEEALGRVLQEQLLQRSERKETENSSALNRLVSRLVKWIKSVFRQYDINDLMTARQTVNDSMQKLGESIISGSMAITKEDLANAKRNAVFNHLKEDVDNVLQLVQNALETERKRLSITPSDDRAQRDTTNQRIATLKGFVNDKDKLEGLINYAKWALEDLSEANRQLDSTITSTDDIRFRSLRNIKTTLESYAEFVKDFRKTLDQYEDAQVVTINGEEINLADLWRRIDEQFQASTIRFESTVLPAFISFVAPFYNESPMKDKNGNIIPLERLFKTADKKDIEAGLIINDDTDINFLDKWGTALGYSSSVIGQLYNDAVKRSKEKARNKTINNIREIWNLQKKAEERGITTFEWMFERNRDGKKTGNYISEYNHGQFEQDYKDFIESLEKKYGKNPFGDDYVNFNKERKAWLNENAQSVFGKPVPNDKYLNPEYQKLSKDQKDTLDEFLDYKAKLEIGIPKDKVKKLKAIQRRKTGAQRFMDVLKNPMTAFNSIAEDAKQAFTANNADDDQLYGTKTTTAGLTDFSGREYMTLPILYTRPLKNPEELSTDVFGDLMAYSYTANVYKELDRIVDPLELGKEAVKQKKLLKTRGGKLIEEEVYVDGKKSKRPVYINEQDNNLQWRIQDFLESQVYGRYLKPQGSVKIGNTEIDAQKTVGLFQKLTSMANLGCNYLVGLANVATAVGMQNIEVAAKEYFSAKDLAKADAAYGKMLPEFLGELANRRKQSKIALFDELFDVRQNTGDKIHNVQMKNLIQRFFGKNWMFVQQGLGDHWVYNRTALAMAMHQKVKVNGKEVSVWDACEIITDETGYKKMRIKPGTKNLDGSDFSTYKFKEKIGTINRHLMGIYNDEDMNAAQRTIFGKLLFQMRQWMLPQMMYRFQSKRHIMALDKEVEGYYRTLGRLVRDMWNAGFKIPAEWKKENISEADKANLHRAFFEIAQAWTIMLMAYAVSSGVKDPDRVWALKLADYMINKEAHELGFLALGPTMITEGVKTIQTPFVAASTANKLAQFIASTANPFNWFPDEDHLVKTGKYAGHGYIYKRFMELPLPVLSQVRQMERFIDDLDTGTKFYSKDYK